MSNLVYGTKEKGVCPGFFQRLIHRDRCGAPPDGAELAMAGRFTASRPFYPRLECARCAFEAGLDATCPILLHFHHESAHSDRFQRAGARAA